MVLQIRRTFQASVDWLRGTMATVKARSVADLAVLNRVAALHEAALALQDNAINPDPQAFAAVMNDVRRQIGSLDAGSMRGDVSALDGIKDPVSRAICGRQLGFIDLLHLIEAVVLGTEQGFRDLIEVGFVNDRRIRDGPGLGGEGGGPSTTRGRAAAKSCVPASVAARGPEEGSHTPKREGTTKGHRGHDEPEVKGRAKVERAPPVLPDTGRNGLTQHGGDAGMKPIAADTADL